MLNRRVRAFALVFASIAASLAAASLAAQHVPSSNLTRPQAAKPQSPAAPPPLFEAPWLKPQDGNFSVRDFYFKSGEKLTELNLHYLTIGTPQRDSSGHVTNAVLLLHGTGGTSKQFLVAHFAGVLFGPGQLLDVSKYYVIIPDDIGHGKSSKPSDGLHARFPHYDYDDMVKAEQLLVGTGLHVDHLRLILGTSMGCMHSWLWGEQFPDYMDGLMPLACQTVPVAGRNRIMRKMIIDSITLDPEWDNGEYKTQPRGLRSALYVLLFMGSAAAQMQKTFPTAAQADRYLEDYVRLRMVSTDANDLLYAVDSSRNYDPSPDLEKIKARVMYINSADDVINPPSLHIAEREIKRVKNGKFILIPQSDETHGHSTHTWAAVWKQYLAELLDSLPR
jgi:homoserine O-acetyltransferase